jgi:hypothetical protein
LEKNIRLHWREYSGIHVRLIIMGEDEETKHISDELKKEILDKTKTEDEVKDMLEKHLKDKSEKEPPE